MTCNIEDSDEIEEFYKADKLASDKANIDEYEVDMSQALSPNFSLNELCASTTALSYGMSNLPNKAVVGALEALVEHVLQPLRDTLSKPIKISSGYRNPELNKRVGGVQNSQHCLGEAADIIIKGMTPTDVAKAIIAMNLEFDQLICEPTWVHVSYSSVHNRKQVMTAVFNNGKANYQSGLCR